LTFDFAAVFDEIILMAVASAQACVPELKSEGGFPELTA
jgi:hypothetical protein